MGKANHRSVLERNWHLFWYNMHKFSCDFKSMGGGCSLGPVKLLTVENPWKKRGAHKHVVTGLISRKYVQLKTREIICKTPFNGIDCFNWCVTERLEGGCGKISTSELGTNCCFRFIFIFLTRSKVKINLFVIKQTLQNNSINSSDSIGSFAVFPVDGQTRAFYSITKTVRRNCVFSRLLIPIWAALLPLNPVRDRHRNCLLPQLARSPARRYDKVACNS